MTASKSINIPAERSKTEMKEDPYLQRNVSFVGKDILTKASKFSKFDEKSFLD